MNLIFTPVVTPHPIADDTQGKFTLFRGFGFRELDKATTDDEMILEVIQPFLEHIKNILCTRNEALYDHFLDWIAHLVQKPMEKTDIFYLFQGQGGAGKSTLKRVFLKLFGSWNTKCTDGLSDVLHHFNSSLEGKCLIFTEELKTDGKADFISAMNKLKNIIDSQDIQITRKGIDSIDVENCLNFLGFSNFIYALPPIEGLDRRVVMNYTSSEKIGDQEYFKKLNDLIDDEHFINCLGTFLMRRDGVTTNKLRYNIPSTELNDHNRFVALTPLEKVLSILYVIGLTPNHPEHDSTLSEWDQGARTIEVTLNDIRQVGEMYNINNLPDPSKTGFAVKTLLGARNQRNKKYNLRVCDTFRMTAIRFSQVLSFLKDSSDMNQHHCLLDNKDNNDNSDD
jgi:hypothetical protein